MKNTEEDIMESDLITDNIEQVRSEIELFLGKLVDKMSTTATPTTVQPPEHVKHPTTPIVNLKTVDHSTPLKTSET